jgi:hypothetical protein
MKLSPSLLRVGMKLSDPDLLQTAEPFYIYELADWQGLPTNPYPDPNHPPNTLKNIKKHIKTSRSSVRSLSVHLIYG